MRKSLEDLKKDIGDFFSDTTRTPEETKDGLEEARDEIDGLLSALDV